MMRNSSPAVMSAIQGLKLHRPTLDPLRKRLKKKREQLARLTAEIEEIESELEQYAYPVHTLPKEIISFIFQHYVPTAPRRASLLHRWSPIMLGHICRAWREIALETPRLWSSFSLVITPKSKMHRILKIARLFLERSAPAPLSFALICESRSRTEDVESMLKLLVSHISRWRDVSLCLHPLPQLSFIQGAMPLLRSVTVVSHKSGGTLVRLLDRPSWSPTESFKLSPLLTRVRLSFEIDSYSESIPWNQLTVVQLEGISFNTLVGILRESDAMVHCRVTIAPAEITHQDELNFKRLPMIHLPYLQTLLLLSWFHLRHDPLRLPPSAHDSRGRITCLKLRLPALRILELSENMLGSNPVNALAALIARSGCALDELCIRDGGRSLMEPYEDAFPGIGKIRFGRLDEDERVRGVFGDRYQEWEDEAAAEVYWDGD
ncbi:Short-chain dehydrogenase/reductase family protein [Mycena chlorophos]|uniref:Short-chain dehydrogenase/reductase family protein n=1 Tax=Mycena chlorophos TaxID=658473 RepID=A0A8H6WI86_MYCCL|nr:Short-chain dehydrogenase/reductase family protein [Mycena chlorophos]